MKKVLEILKVDKATRGLKGQIVHFGSGRVLIEDQTKPTPDLVSIRIKL